MFLEDISNYFIPILNISLYRFIVSISFLFGFMLFKKLIYKVSIMLITKVTKKTKTNLDDDLIGAFRKPLRFLITMIGIYLFFKILNTPIIKEITLTRILRGSIIGTIGWGLYNLGGAFEILNNFLGNKLNIKGNSILFPLMSKFLRIIIVLLTFGTILAEFDYPVDTFVTGLGISGLAVALATQDSLANIFGGITLLIDKPFSIGDWISFGDTEGVVEDISLRSIRIRTFEKALVTVPNKKLANENITNYSKRGIRRIKFNLGVTYTTSNEKLELLVCKIEDTLKNHNDVNKENTLLVKFDGFGSSSLDIFIYFFVNTANWDEYLTIKQSINFEVLKLCEEIGVEIAFPTTTVYLENNE